MYCEFYKYNSFIENYSNNTFSIYLYGDSHVWNSFKNLPLSYTDHHHNSITMFRIGRDNKIINFDNNEHDKNSIICLVYGEVDCRCHIQKQINLGKIEDEIIYSLVTNYINTIKNNIIVYKDIIIVGIIPPIKRKEVEDKYGAITHEFPFVGTDEERVRFTNKTNKLLETLCKENNYIYFNPYSYYSREDGTLKYECSDGINHLRENSVFLDKFIELINSL
jgi:hypothetical protein